MQSLDIRWFAKKAALLFCVILTAWFGMILGGAMSRAQLAAGQIIHYPETGYHFPPTSDISYTKATWFTRTNEWKELSIPPTYWENAMKALSPSELDTAPARWQILGSLTITTKQREQCWVRLYRTDDQLGAFSAGPTSAESEYYRGGNSMDVLLAIFDACGNVQRDDKDKIRQQNR